MRNMPMDVYVVRKLQSLKKSEEFFFKELDTNYRSIQACDKSGYDFLYFFSSLSRKSNKIIIPGEAN